MKRSVLLLIAGLVLVSAGIGAQSGDQGFRITTVRDASDLFATPFAAPAAPSELTASVNGPIVTLAWTQQTDATSYVLRAGLSPGATVLEQNVGNVLSVTLNAPATGTFFVRMYGRNAEGTGPLSNEVAVVVTSMVPQPAAPTNFQFSMNGRTVFFSWTNAPFAAGVIIDAGTTPGGAEVGSFPLGLPSSLTVPNFPVGTIYARLRSFNAGGSSAPSAELTIVMPVGGSCTTPAVPTLTASAYSTYVRLNWTAVPGVASYRLDVGDAPGATSFQFPFGATQTTFATGGAPLRTYYMRLVAGNSCGATSTSPEVTLVVDGSAGTGPRTPDPTTNQCGRFAVGPERPCTPPPNRLSVVSRLASQFAAEFQGSCGNDRFLFRLVQELRKEDSRWGLNWKRAVRGDFSKDVIAWHWGVGPDEDSYDVSIIDFIGNHCGGSHSPAWQDHTELGTRGAVWTLIPYLDRGYPPNPQ